MHPLLKVLSEKISLNTDLQMQFKEINTEIPIFWSKAFLKKVNCLNSTYQMFSIWLGQGFRI